jgi:hypothetical protein
MTRKRIILGACAVCIAVASAFASYSVGIWITVRIFGVSITVWVPHSFFCSTGATKCLVKVVTVGGTSVVAAAATVITANGTTIPGSGLVGFTARTLGD